MKRSHSSVDREELYSSVEEGSLRDVEALVDQGADIHARFNKFPSYSSSSTAMHIAASYGHQQLLAFFLNKGCDVNITDTHTRNTPLHLASEAGHAEVVQFLLDQNANMNAVNMLRQKPIQVAAKAGKKDVVQMFLEKGMDVKEADGRGSTLLHLSCSERNLKLVELLVSYKSDIHAKDAAGRKPIHIAAACGQNDIVEYFLDLGLRVDETDQNGQTVLHRAAKRGRFEVVQLLVDRMGTNPQLDARDNDGKTPLHLGHCNPDILNCLLDAGARSDTKDHDGRTAMFYFISFRYYNDDQSVVFAKMNHNFVDMDDQTKVTAAHLIVKKVHNMNLIELVLQYQKDLNVEDKYGRMPMNYLIRNVSLQSIDRQERLIRLFVDHGAYFKLDDCERIVQNHSLKERLFMDKNFCFQYLVNKFDNNDLPMLGKLPSSMSLSILERLKLKSSQIRLIESAVEEAIRNKGHCDFSKMMPPLLSISAIESYISHYCTS